ncbi:hypothetical protein JTB14_022899 [Gonioctena quinquepunctata]|nr:hypothetical protein JTB14_022899 [Gonioctena quinquepunctata]
MIRFIGLFSLAHIVMLLGFTNAQEEKVNVAVYYETLCPDAKQFMVHQLQPLLKGDLSTYINLTLVPYGKAHTTLENGVYSFSCHHGNVECYGNKLQACSLIFIDFGNSTDKLGYNKNAVEFVICLMDGVKSTTRIDEIQSVAQKCDKTGVYGILKKCVDDAHIGSQFLNKLGMRTNELQNPLEYVPTIVYNEVFDKEESDQSVNDFKKVFCSKVKSKNVSACSNGEDQRKTHPEVDCDERRAVV